MHVPPQLTPRGYPMRPARPVREIVSVDGGSDVGRPHRDARDAARERKLPLSGETVQVQV